MHVKGYARGVILALPFVAGACITRAAPAGESGAAALAPLSPACPSVPGAPRTADDSASYAVRCAEDFVLRNGYTRPPPPIVRLPGESLEQTRQRAQTMEFWVPVQPTAYGFCPRSGWPYIVVFEYQPDAIPKADAARKGVGQALSMDRAFNNLTFHDQGFRLDAVDQRVEGCRPLKGR